MKLEKVARVEEDGLIVESNKQIAVHDAAAEVRYQFIEKEVTGYAKSTVLLLIVMILSGCSSTM